MTALRRTGLVLALLFAATAALAADTAAVIPLEHRNAAELLPTLRTIAGEDARIAADGDRLVIRGPAATVDALRETVGALDHPLAELRVSVRIAPDTGTAANGNTERHSAGTAAAAVQRVRVREGGQAVIDTGRLEAEPKRWYWAGSDGTGFGEVPDYRDLPRGFTVTPQLTGGRVHVRITVRRDRRDGADIDTDTLITTVTGPLGEWLTLARTGTDTGDDRENVKTWRAGGDGRRIELRVDRLD
ncbi:secretin N-terminal domain-containing protein [Arhodomonas sp. KWT2]|uniref:secretin N-terminal domain-containing protein n=1 Tax=Arhodomonas sp. KWT2 TaxID=3344194 RepID=UPI0035C11200